MACVYLHKTLQGEIFYIGIGNSTKRAYSFYDRNPFWKNVVAKYGYTVEILYDNIPRKEAQEVETYLIYYYGRRILGTGNLVNLADGDIGSCGYKHTKEAKRKISLNNAKTKSKKIIDTSNGKIYPSLKEYSNINNLKYTTLKAKLNGQNKNNTTLKYI